MVNNSLIKNRLAKNRLVKNRFIKRLINNILTVNKGSLFSNLIYIIK